MPKKIFLNLYRKSIQKMSKGRGFGKNPIVKKILKNIEVNLKTEFAELQGSKMFLDLGDSLNLSINGVYGELDTKIIREEIHEGDIVVDVGANIGYYTLIFAQLVGKSGKVFAFEPEPKNFEILKKNIEINNYQNIIAEQKIVSDKSGMMKLFIAEQGIVGHRIQQKTDSQKFIEIESIILDDYLKNLNLSGKINFIKIDVEGAEVKVLEGSKIIIEKSDQLKIFTEFNREDIKKYNYDPEYLLSFLIKNKFNFFLPNYKTNTVLQTDKNTLLSSEELLKENLNILCKK
jgi:FkbM family methyltransferase